MVALAMVSIAAAACTPVAAQRTSPFPAPTAGSVAVLPARDLTSTTDAVDTRGTSIVDRVLGRDQPTVAEVVTAAASSALQNAGWNVVAPHELGVDGGPRDVAAATRTAAAAVGPGALLDLEIRRWEPDATTHPAFVIVGVHARLLEVGTGRELWRATPPVHPVSTAGSVTLTSAYQTAAATVVRELLAGRAPAR